MISASHISPLMVWLLDNLRPAPLGAPPPPGLDDPAQGRAALDVIRHHRIATALAPALLQDARIPSSWRADFAALRRRRALRLLGMAAEALRLGRVLDEAGVPHILLKGLSAGAVLHGGLTERDAVDIDMAIAPDAMDAACAALGRLGYQRIIGPEDGPDNPCPPSTVALRRAGASWTVELHGQLADDFALFPLARPFDIAVPLKIGAGVLRALPRETAVVYAAFHGDKHLWDRLAWLTDIAAACRSDMDWTDALAQARRLGCVRHLVLAVRLAHDLLGAPVPPAVGDSGASATITEWANRLAPLICAAPPLGSRDMFYRIGLGRTISRDIRMHQGVGAKLAAVRRRFRPTADDRRLARLPRGLYGLYYLLRILRLGLAATGRHMGKIPR